MTTLPRGILAAVASLAAVAALTAAAAPQPAPITQSFTASVSGTPLTSPANGVLTIYDNETALHHTRSVDYYMNDGYRKTAILTSSTRPEGVVLAAEDIENNCGTYSLSLGGLNPAGGTGIRCTPALHTTEVTYPVTGDLVGRFCRVPPPGTTGTCPFVRHVTETATGSGTYLTVGGKDHGALLEVEYYTWDGTQEYDVQVTLPIPVLVTRIVLQPTTAVDPYAVLTLQ